MTPTAKADGRSPDQGRSGTRVPIAILTWRGEETTRTCVRSLVRLGTPVDSIVVIDNGSGTGEGERIAAEFGVRSLTLAANGGVPAGYNAAIEWAAAQGARYLLAANNDLLFTDAELVQQLLAHARDGVAAVGPLVLKPDGSVASAGGRLRSLIGHVQRTRRPWRPGPYDVDALDGSCILISLDAVCTVGGLAPEFFLYWEETDWCVRARKAGFRLIVEPGVAVTHTGLGSGDLRQARRYALRNSLLFIRRNLRGPLGLVAGSFWLCGRLPYFILRRAIERARPADVLADLRWAVTWHLRDVRERGWPRPADGPNLCR